MARSSGSGGRNPPYGRPPFTRQHLPAIARFIVSEMRKLIEAVHFDDEWVPRLEKGSLLAFYDVLQTKSDRFARLGDSPDQAAALASNCQSLRVNARMSDSFSKELIERSTTGGGDLIIRAHKHFLDLLGRIAQQDEYALNGVAEHTAIALSQAPQVAAPIRTKIVEGRLETYALSTSVGLLDDASRMRSRRAAAAAFQLAIDILSEGGNLHRGFLPPCHSLIVELRKSPNSFSPEMTGTLSRIVEGNLTAFADELPNGVEPALVEALGVTQVVLGQYREWSIFTSEEARLALSPENTNELLEIAEEIEDALSQSPKIASENVVEQLKVLLQPIHDGIAPRSEVVIPLLFSLQNIMIGFSEIMLHALSTPIGQSTAAGLITAYVTAVTKAGWKAVRR